MKVLTIIENNRITGVVYGMVDIDEHVSTISHNTPFKEIKQTQIKNLKRLYHTRQK